MQSMMPSQTDDISIQANPEGHANALLEHSEKKTHEKTANPHCSGIATAVCQYTTKLGDICTTSTGIGPSFTVWLFMNRYVQQKCSLITSTAAA